MKKNIGKLLTIFVPLIFAVILLWPTYSSYELVQKETAAKLEGSEAAKNSGNIIDSINVMEEFKNNYGEDLASAKNQALKLGLDLQGGMYLTLEVDVIKLIEENAQAEAIDDVFQDVLNKTAEDSKESEENTMDIFFKNFDEMARPQHRTLISYFDIGDISDASEEKIVERLRSDAVSAIDQAKEVISRRIDKYGVSEPNIQKQGNNRIMLELPGVKDEKEVRELLQTTARLEFKLLRNNVEIVRAFQKIDEFLASKARRTEVRKDTEAPAEEIKTEETTEVVAENNAVENADSTNVAADSATVAANDTAGPVNPYEGLSEDEQLKEYLIDHQFTSMFMTFYLPGNNQRGQQVQYVGDLPEGTYSFSIPADSITKFETILESPEIRALIPFNLEVAVSDKASYTAENGVKIHSVYSLKREPELTGDVITNALTTLDPTNNQPLVSMSMNSEGSERWAKITGANVGKQIAIVLDKRVYSAPVVNQKITGGNSQISGMENLKEADLLKIVLKAGALKAPVKIIEERVVGPSLGEDSIQSGFYASIAAFILVILYMMFYYGTAGIVADFAVILNVTLIMAVLAVFKGTLTLPGIAGMILTIGMAVDANVLIFERIREELYRGRSLRAAIDEGFSKALSAIIDSNITSFITASILYSLGEGPIKGFALTFMIGIFGTLFTGIVVTRAIIEMSVAGGKTNYNFGQKKSLVNN